MESFSALNKKKLPFIFGVISLVILTIIALILVCVWIANTNFPAIKGLAVLVFMAGIVAPAFMLLLLYIGWYVNRKARWNVLKKLPFVQLRDIGFETAYMNADTRLFFTEETLEATIDGYRVQFNVNREASKKIEFVAFVYTTDLDKGKHKRLENLFEKEDIYFDLDGIAKKYDSKKAFNSSINQLNTELTQFIETLKQEGFKPRLE